MIWPSLGSQAIRCQFVSYPCSAALEGPLRPWSPSQPHLGAVSACAARQRLVPGQVRVADGVSAIVAILTLLDLLAIAGVIATIDCQRGIAPTILNKKADYVLALEGNQGTVHDVALFAAGKAKAFAEASVSRYSELEGDHGAPPLMMPQGELLRAIREFPSPRSVFAGRGRAEAGSVQVRGRHPIRAGRGRFLFASVLFALEGRGERSKQKFLRAAIAACIRSRAQPVERSFSLANIRLHLLDKLIRKLLPGSCLG